MKLLKDIKIKGEIFSEYVFLTYEFGLDDTADGKNVDYIFRLPNNSLLSDMKIIDADGKLTMAKVVAASYAAQLGETNAAAVLRRAGNETYLLSVKGAAAGVRVKVNVYTLMAKNGDEIDVTIPLTAGNGTGKTINNFAGIELNAAGAAEIKAISPTHRIKSEYMGSNGNRLRVTTGRIPADRDFSLRLKGGSRKNRMIMSNNGLSADALCVVYPSLDFYEACKRYRKKIVFIFDNTSLFMGAARAAKEFILFAAKACGRECSIMYKGGGGTAEVNFGDSGDMSGIEKILSGIDRSGGALSELLQRAAEKLDSDIVPILITADRNADAGAAEVIKRGFKNTGISAVRFGAVSWRDEITSAVQMCGGSVKTVFGMDDIRKKARETVRSIDFSAMDIGVEALGTEKAAIIDYPDEIGDGIGIYLDYGKSCTLEPLSVHCGGYSEEIRFDNIETYDSFAPTGLVYARLMSRQLTERLKFCAADEVQKLRKALEAIGVRYSAVNSETAYIAEFNGATAVIRIAIEDTSVYGYSVFDNRTSMFSETYEEYTDETVRLCTKVLIKSMRSDGAICAAGEIDGDIRRRQTLICVLALISAECIEPDCEFVKAAERYIGGYSDGKLRFTRDAETAREVLKPIFGDEFQDTVGVMPDLYTSARVVYLCKHPNNKLFGKTLD